MVEKELLERLDGLHEKNDHRLIIWEISRLAPELRGSYPVQSRLARAYGNMGEYTRAMGILEPLREQGAGDYLWWHRMACGCYGLGRYRECRECLERVLALGGEEEVLEQSRRMLRDMETLEMCNKNGGAKNKKGKGDRW